MGMPAPQVAINQRLILSRRGHNIQFCFGNDRFALFIQHGGADHEWKIRRIVLDKLRRLSYVGAMSRQSLPRPTEAELALLQVLWERGPSTVRAIHEALRSEKDTTYTTTLKILQNMTEKGLVQRDESRRSHVYRAALQAEQTQRQLVRDLLQRVFRGTPGKLVLHALSEEQPTREELAEIRKLIDALETRQAKRRTP
jgi:predicted transcriptional regulator